MNGLQTKVATIRAELNGVLIERDVAIETALVALLAREHLLLLGPPGTAKSLLVREIVSHLDGARMFERLMTKFSTPEELFGPLSLSALKGDRYERVGRGMLQESEIGFVDEVFKANSAILNSLLTLVNERLYHEGGMGRPAPLLSLFGASNETPEDESLGALDDRFLMRLVVPYLTSDDSMRKLFDMDSAAPATVTKLSLDELRQAQAEVKAIPLGVDAREALIEIKHALENEGIAVSDRRWRAVVRVVKAKAWLDGATTATSDHVEILVHALWRNPDQRRVVDRCVNKVCNPLTLLAVEREDAARELYAQRPAEDAADYEARMGNLLRQLADIHKELSKKIAAASNGRATRAIAAQKQVATWHRELGAAQMRRLNRYQISTD